MDDSISYESENEEVAEQFRLNYKKPGHPDKLLSLELDSTGTELFLGYLVETYSKLVSLYTYV